MGQCYNTCEVIELFIRRKKQSKFVRGALITIVVLIAVGMVIPLAGLFQKQPGNSGAPDVAETGQSLEERLADLESKAKENPGDKAVLTDLAQAYFYAGKPDQAVKTYEQVLALDPADGDVRIDIATIYYYSSKYDQAVAQLQELLKQDPENQNAHYLYGIVLGTGKEDYAGGIQELEKFVALAKEGPDVAKAKQAIEEWKAKQAQK